MAFGNIKKSIFGVAGIVFVSKLLGFIRELIIAEKFGTSAVYDRYLIAIMLPALLCGIFSYAGVYLLVPYFSEKLKNQNQKESNFWSYAWGVINLKISLSIMVTTAIILLAPFIMKFWTVGFSHQSHIEIIFYTRITAIAVFFVSLEAIFRSFLNVKKIFNYPASGYIIFNIFSISLILLLADELSVGAIAVGWLGGLLLQNLFLFLRILNFKPYQKFNLKIRKSDLDVIFKSGVILLLIEFLNRTYFMIDRYFAVRFDEGIISAINYSNVLVLLPDSIIGVAVASVLFPYFSENYIQDRLKFKKYYIKSVTAIVFLAVPIAAIMYINAENIIYLLFNRGEFDAVSQSLTTSVFIPLIPSVIALMIISISLRAAYAGKWYKEVLLIAIFVYIIKLFGSWILSDFYGQAGITAASSVAFGLFAIMLVSFLIFKLGYNSKFKFLFSLLILVSLGLISAYLSMNITSNVFNFESTTKFQSLLYLFISGFFVLIIYMPMIYLFKLKLILPDELFKRNLKID